MRTIFICSLLSVLIGCRPSSAAIENWSLSPSALHFATVAPGASVERTFTISNAGAAELAVSFQLEDPSHAFSLGQSVKVPPSGLVEVPVLFSAPAAPATLSAMLAAVSAAGQRFEITLTASVERPAGGGVDGGGGNTNDAGPAVDAGRPDAGMNTPWVDPCGSNAFGPTHLPLTDTFRAARIAVAQGGITVISWNAGSSYRIGAFGPSGLALPGEADFPGAAGLDIAVSGSTLGVVVRYANQTAFDWHLLSLPGFQLITKKTFSDSTSASAYVAIDRNEASSTWALASLTQFFSIDDGGTVAWAPLSMTSQVPSRGMAPLGVDQAIVVPGVHHQTLMIRHPVGTRTTIWAGNGGDFSSYSALAAITDELAVLAQWEGRAVGVEPVTPMSLYRFSRDGSALTTTSFELNAVTPAVVHDGSGWVVAWSSLTGGRYHLWATRVDAAGVEQPSARRQLTCLSTGNAVFPAMAWANDRAVIVFQVDNSRGGIVTYQPE